MDQYEVKFVEEKVSNWTNSNDGVVEQELSQDNGVYIVEAHIEDENHADIQSETEIELSDRHNYQITASSSQVVLQHQDSAVGSESDFNEIEFYGNEESSDSDFRYKKKQSTDKKLKNKSKGCKQLGRQRDDIWTEFLEVPGKRGKMACLACNTKVTGRAYLMKAHKKKCRQNNTKLNLPTLARTTAAVPASLHVPASAPQQTLSQPICATKKQSGLKKFFDVLSRSEQAGLDLKLGKFIFGANIPFNVVENKQFQDFVTSLRPAYQIPSHEVIGGRILDQVFDAPQEVIRRELEGKEVTLSQDGWSTISNAPVIAHALSTGTKTYFMDAVETGTSTKTSKFCSDMLEVELLKVEQTYNVKVIGCVTDNCNAMNATRHDLGQRYKNIHLYGCNTHLLNLLGKKLSPNSLFAKIKKVQAYFRNHHFESESLKQLGGCRPVLPCETRWNSQIDCLKSYIRNHTKYLEISRLPGSGLNDELKEIINNNQTFDEARNTVEILEPICTSLDRDDTATVADAIHCWIKVSSSLPESVKATDYFLKYLSWAMMPASVAAYLLHPVYRGKDTPAKYAELGRDWLRSRNPYFLAVAGSLAAGDEDMFPRSYLDRDVAKRMNPCVWWSVVSENNSSIPKPLVDVAKSILKLPASTSGLERCFSTLAGILTKTRNRLGMQKAMKLCFVYQQLKRSSSASIMVPASTAVPASTTVPASASDSPEECVE